MKPINKAHQLAKVGGNKFLLPLNIQYFAEGDPVPTPDPVPADPTPTPDPIPDPTPIDPPAKTFTQDDVTGLVAKEAKKAQEKLLKQLGVTDFDNAKDGLQKFKEWQESQKTEAEKKQEALENLQKDSQAKDDQLFSANAKLSALTSGVQADFLDDVIVLAKAQISDDVDMNEAIAKVVEKYPHFKGEVQQEQQQAPKFTTGQHTKQQTSELDKWVDAFKF